ncbi:hypothetical protein ACPW96_21440 [Micromonospora sp. DT81.3]|uniref:hypothetical protein n=1 Tax=Micromonospora sp. DT81.3 TaxID=3416523 RepID=UPI003CF2DF75
MNSAEPRSPFGRRGFVLAAIIVGVIVLAAIVVLVTSLTRGPDPQTDPTPRPSPSSSSTGDPADASVCGLAGFEDASSLDTAPENDWELVGTMAAPVNETSGPGTVDGDGFRSCFAHTSEGALFAAVNFVATGTDATIGPRLIELVAPGPGRDALASKPPSGGPSNLRAQVVGYRVLSYSADAATIDLAVNYSTGQLVSIPLKLLWAEGDWKLEMTDAGDLPLAPAEIQNLGGYTPWSGA